MFVERSAAVKGGYAQAIPLKPCGCDAGGPEARVCLPLRAVMGPAHRSELAVSYLEPGRQSGRPTDKQAEKLGEKDI
ncbi:hypothetical protein C0Q70_16263 [Pomacea canaliculata]|uniref:Uncharacterized protein n=1 Tax=Pomacea canaliculata TaxID=400727 RepID=A0A2T7NPC8_POMCA|nr:hypothetical protein C0Q70_16263 [Pomacea canaliculata]